MSADFIVTFKDTPCDVIDRLFARRFESSVDNCNHLLGEYIGDDTPWISK